MNANIAHAETFHTQSDLGSGSSSSDGQSAPMSLDEALERCRRLTTTHYENFSVLSRLVPVSLRDDFAAVYAFCRWSDDLADETGADEAARSKSLELLRSWRGELDRCVEYARAGADERGDQARPTHPVFIALAETIRRRQLDEAPFHHLIDAFEQDQRVAHYQTWEELLGYCQSSADPVGRIVLALGGCRSDDEACAELFQMSDAICTALQLTNFWQDVRRDLLERNRVYMPIEETGLGADQLREMAAKGDEPEARIAFIKALRPLVERTRELFAQGRALPRALDPQLRHVVWLFLAGGESVLTSVERLGCATLWRRPALSPLKKASLVGAASVARLVTPNRRAR